MKYNLIPKTDLKVSEIALGTWVIGGQFWQGSDEGESIKAIHKAIDQGINLIDTAPIYGNGYSEKIVGKAIKGKRGELIVATKCGLTVSGDKILHDLTAQSIEVEVESSLSKLGIEAIDLYQCHWPDENTSVESSMGALNKLKKQGKIRHIGLSNYNVRQIKECTKFAEIVTLQSQLSLLDRELESEIIPFCVQQNIGILAYGPLAGGILSGKYKEPPKFDGPDARSFFYKYYKGEAFDKVKAYIEKLKEFNKPLDQLAIKWVAYQPSVVSALVGCRTEEQVIKNSSASNLVLNENELEQITTLKL